jgi:spore coat assembly protein SafA
MKYRIRIMIAVALLIVMIPVAAYAQTTKYTVVKGDSLWKIAVKFQVGLSEIISANPQFKNPNLIYPGSVYNA